MSFDLSPGGKHWKLRGRLGAIERRIALISRGDMLSVPRRRLNYETEARRSLQHLRLAAGQ